METSRPLQYLRDVLAVLLSTAPARDFAEYLDFLKTVGQLIGGAFEKTLLLERLERGNDELAIEHIHLAADSFDVELAVVFGRSCFGG